MRLGFNFTLGDTYPMVQRLIAEGHIDYCEVMVDNFLCIEPKDLAKAFACPIGVHMMFSRFLEIDRETVVDLASRLRPYMAELDPIYVSDHITCFTHEGRHFSHLGEFDYFDDYPATRDRIALWQELLGRPLLLENYPSIMDGGWDAPEFFERLREDTAVGVLFDASNAVCSNFNCGLPLQRWDCIVESNRHYHVAGYRPSLSEPHIRQDTHDRALAQDTLDYLSSRKPLFDKPGATMTYERDDDIDYDQVVADLTRLRQIFPASQTVAA